MKKQEKLKYDLDLSCSILTRVTETVKFSKDHPTSLITAPSTTANGLKMVTEMEKEHRSGKMEVNLLGTGGTTKPMEKVD